MGNEFTSPMAKDTTCCCALCVQSQWICTHSPRCLVLREKLNLDTNLLEISKEATLLL